MIASQQNSFGLGVRPFAPPVLDGPGHNGMPLDELPLTQVRPAPIPLGPAAAKTVPAAKVKAAPRAEAQPAPARPGRQAQAAAGTAASQALRRRRPLSRFLEGDDNPGFYLSLSDLMCLLLVFFVLIFSLTEPGAPAPSAAQAAPAAAVPAPKKVVKAAMPLKPLPFADPFPHPEPVPAGVRLSMISVASAGQSDPGLVAEPPQTREDGGSSQNFDRALFALVGSGAPLPASALPEEEPGLEAMLAQGVEVEKNSERVLLRLPESITFDLARADIKPAMGQTLARLVDILARHPEVPVVVTGHTDDLPISTPAFASNWELSSARASAVGRALTAQGLDQSRLTIRGLADRQPRAPNTSEANRGQNRRVEIELRLNS